MNILRSLFEGAVAALGMAHGLQTGEVNGLVAECYVGEDNHVFSIEHRASGLCTTFNRERFPLDADRERIELCAEALVGAYLISERSYKED